MTSVNPRHDGGRARPRWLTTVFAVLVIAALVLPATARARAPKAGAGAERPNIVFVITDDQDAATLQRIAGLPSFDTRCPGQPGRAMPCLQELLADRGVTFTRHTAAFSQCCPSRATFLSGQYGHNNGVRGNLQYDNLDAANVLPVWLQEAGYATAYAGKYQGPFFFGWGHSAHPDGVPPGWDRFWVPSDINPAYHAQFNYLINDDGTPVFYGSNDEDYLSDHTTDVAVEFIERQADDAKPFFLGVGYVAPHYVPEPFGGEVETPGLVNNTERLSDREGVNMLAYNSGPPVPAPRHRDELERFLGAELKAPRSPAFNEADVSDKPAFVRDIGPLNEAEIARIDRHYAFRLASLLAVDEGIHDMVDALKRTGQYDNTYFIFTSDNGWFQGEHRLPVGKVHVYEESTRLPMVIAGPGVRPAASADEATSNVDWVATILDLADAQPNSGFELDGMSLVPYLSNPLRQFHRVVFHETTDDDAGYVAARAGRWKYVEYNNGERELYDLLADPHELTSRHADPRLRTVVTSLSELLARFRTCHGQTGENPCLVIGDRGR